MISGTTARLSRLGCVLLFLAGLGAEPLLAQAVPPPSPEVQARLAESQARLDETARELAKEPRAKRISPQQLQALVEFVVGNALFVATHEMGHAVISEMDLPVLGRDEDAPTILPFSPGSGRWRTIFPSACLSRRARGVS